MVLTWARLKRCGSSRRSSSTSSASRTGTSSWRRRWGCCEPTTSLRQAVVLVTQPPG